MTFTDYNKNNSKLNYAGLMAKAREKICLSTDSTFLTMILFFNSWAVQVQKITFVCQYIRI